MSTKSKTLFVNALTFSRVPLIFIYLILAVLGNFRESVAYAYAACAFAAAAGFSDFFDGYLARKWGVVSDFGKMADPLMDKVDFIVAFPSLVWLEIDPQAAGVHHDGAGAVVAVVDEATLGIVLEAGVLADELLVLAA